MPRLPLHLKHHRPLLYVPGAQGRRVLLVRPQAEKAARPAAASNQEAAERIFAFIKVLEAVKRHKGF